MPMVDQRLNEITPDWMTVENGKVDIFYER